MDNQNNKKQHYNVVFILSANVERGKNGNFKLSKTDPSGLPLLSNWRIKAIKKLYKNKLADKFIFVGYKEKALGENIWRSEVMKEIARKRFPDIPKEKIEALNQAKDKTEGNVEAIKNYIKTNNLEVSKCAFLTNFYHIPRASIGFIRHKIFLHPLAAESFFTGEESIIRRDYGQTQFTFFDRLISEMEGMKDHEFGTYGNDKKIYMKPGKDYIGVGCGALIVNDKNETLLVKRTSKSQNEAGFWSKPGGTVEFNEKVEDAIKREIKEELGIDIELTKPLGFTNHILNSENQHWVAIHYLAKIINGEPCIVEPDKIEEIRWFSFNNLPSNLTQTTKDPIRDYLGQLENPNF